MSFELDFYRTDSGSGLPTLQSHSRYLNVQFCIRMRYHKLYWTRIWKTPRKPWLTEKLLTQLVLTSQVKIIHYTRQIMMSSLNLIYFFKIQQKADCNAMLYINIKMSGHLSKDLICILMYFFRYCWHRKRCYRKFSGR